MNGVRWRGADGAFFLNKAAEKLGLFGFLNKQRSSDFTFPFCPRINMFLRSVKL